ncbi:MAG TPA: iron-containing alcohol dehydrogenase [Terriglobia bacterium]|nr:iron-containing alcohol dehydrogenase [Terriglobia bacterium]
MRAGEAMRFELATAGRILFGAGAVREVRPAAQEIGRRVLLVTGRSPERAAGLRDDLVAAGMACSLFTVAGEPSLDLVRQGTEQARREQSEMVISFGGGSAIDAGKAIAALLTNRGGVTDYLEVIGKGQPLGAAPAPFIAIPTTAGTGSEVTRNAVLSSPEHRVKVSLRSPRMLAALAVIDPELTLGLPPAITASTGLDALTQLIEPYVSSRANPVTDGFCLEGLRRVSHSLERAYRDGSDIEARSDMSLASLLGGLALANSGLGVVHGFAGPVGGMFSAAHGAICAALLPHGMETNIRALRARAPTSEPLKRYEQIAGLLTGKAEARAEDGVLWVRRLCQQLKVSPLRSYGVREQDFPSLAAKASKASSMKGNPIALTEDELHSMLARAL